MTQELLVTADALDTQASVLKAQAAQLRALAQQAPAPAAERPEVVVDEPRDFFSHEQLSTRYDIDRSTLSAWRADGSFPQPDWVVNGTKRWSRAFVVSWEKQQKPA